MKFEHVSFNDNFWKGKPLKQFLNEEGHHGLSVEQLTEAHTLINREEPAAEDAKSDEAAEEKIAEGPAADVVEKGASKKNMAKQNA